MGLGSQRGKQGAGRTVRVGGRSGPLGRTQVNEAQRWREATRPSGSQVAFLGAAAQLEEGLVVTLARGQ